MIEEGYSFPHTGGLMSSMEMKKQQWCRCGGKSDFFRKEAVLTELTRFSTDTSRPLTAFI
ncbi:MAG: hypothetical protein K8T89_16665 [Planctomycetes bacterium]|nr:hypothetical protein [Planctomycetota bacterium]